MSLLSRKTIAKKLLESKKFREAFVFEQIKRHIPFQVRTMRTEREWSQAKAGEALGKPQNVISRLESPAYGKLTLQTLIDIAHGFDVGLIIKFVPFSRLVREYEDVSFDALSAKSVSDEKEAEKLQKWALGESVSPITTTVAASPLPARDHGIRKLVEGIKVWRSKTSASVKTGTSLPITFIASDLLLEMFMEGKRQQIKSTSTDSEMSEIKGLESYIPITAMPNLPPKNTATLDYTNLPAS